MRARPRQTKQTLLSRAMSATAAPYDAVAAENGIKVSWLHDPTSVELLASYAVLNTEQERIEDALDEDPAWVETSRVWRRGQGARLHPSLVTSLPLS